LFCERLAAKWWHLFAKRLAAKWWHLFAKRLATWLAACREVCGCPSCIATMWTGTAASTPPTLWMLEPQTHINCTSPPWGCCCECRYIAYPRACRGCCCQRTSRHRGQQPTYLPSYLPAMHLGCDIIIHVHKLQKTIHATHKALHELAARVLANRQHVQPLFFARPKCYPHAVMKCCHDVLRWGRTSQSLALFWP
jgi:hypothetical protein